MTIVKSKVNEWEERIQNLIQQIQYWIENPTEKTIEIIELFYLIHLTTFFCLPTQDFLVHDTKKYYPHDISFIHAFKMTSNRCIFMARRPSWSNLV